MSCFGGSGSLDNGLGFSGNEKDPKSSPPKPKLKSEAGAGASEGVDEGVGVEVDVGVDAGCLGWGCGSCFAGVSRSTGAGL